MPPTRRTPFKIPGGAPAGRDIGALHVALMKIGHELPHSEIKAGVLGEATKAVIRDLQTRTGLTPDGRLSASTVAAIDRALAHVFFAKNKTRTAELQDMLGRLGQHIDPAERKARAFGASTEAALKAFQKGAGLVDDGRMNDVVFERLEGSALAKRLSSKTQASALQRKLIHVGKIAKLDIQIAKDELKSGTLGPTTKEFVRKFQTKYGLPSTGEVDPRTYERIESVAASRARPLQKLVVRPGETVTTVRHGLRINKKGPSVGQLQRSLAVLGFKIDQAEHAAATFGKTTRSAVVAFQKQRRLAQSGEVDAETRQAINVALVNANPATVQPGAGTYRLRGSVRDERWKGIRGARVEVWIIDVQGNGAKVAERKTTETGFYDVAYPPPRNPVNKQIQLPFRLAVRVFDPANKSLFTREVFNPTSIAWQNFTKGKLPYRGTSEYTERMAAVTKAMGTTATITTLEQSAERSDVSRVADAAALSIDDVLRLVLAHRAAAALGDAAVGAPALYAFIRQSVPATLPSDLLAETYQWTKIDTLVDKALTGIVLLEKPAQAMTFDSAVKENLIPVETALQRNAILAAFDAKRPEFALKKPTLGATGTLETLLAKSPIAAPHRAAVAAAYVSRGGMGPEFWKDLYANAAAFGGKENVKGFEVVAQLGEIARQHAPTLGLLKSAIDDPQRPMLEVASDFAKLDAAGWESLLQNVPEAEIPADIAGAPAARKKAYAARLASAAERQFPAIALTACVQRAGAPHGLDRLADVQKLLADRPDLDLATSNVDKFVKDNALPVAKEVRDQTKVIQRVGRLAPNAAVGAALLESKIHHSTQIMAMGKVRFVRLLQSKKIDRKTAMATFERAEQRYAELLARLSDYRLTLHQADPQAIVPHTYSAEERAHLAGEIPNIEALFGPADFCDCGECQSVYSPAAYLADLFRFLDAHETEKRDKTVVDHMFERRPDLGDLLLDCDNTKTPLPYVDLVCEILERVVSPPAPLPASRSFQTTRPAAELRAFPENVSAKAYDALRAADFPMDGAFDLWQEEARVWLDHLGVPRHTLMEIFQARPQGGPKSPLDSSIAGEAFGMSSHETTLVTTPAADARQNPYWGFDASRTKVGVREILDHGKLTYPELLALLDVTWIQQPAAPGKLTISPLGACDVALQSIENLTLMRFDRIHRFLRLWRRTGWAMWELDLLIRAKGVGAGKLDGDTLASMHRFRRVQSTLGVPFEAALAFYAPLNREERPRPDDRTKKTLPLYALLFQNPNVVDPVDPAFSALTGTETLAGHARALLAALAVNDADLSRLIARTDGKLTLANLTRMFAELTLARGLGLSVEEWHTLLSLEGGVDVFASPARTLEFIDRLRTVTAAGLTVSELDYVLQYRPLSHFGLREESVTATLSALRESLRAAFEQPRDTLEQPVLDELKQGIEKKRRGIVIDRVAATFSLPAEQASLLLSTLRAGAPAPGKLLIDVLAAPELTEKNPDGNWKHAIAPARFGRAYEAVRLLHKVSLLLSRAKIDSAEDLKWLLTAHGKIKSLDFSKLPVSGPPAAPLFEAWLAMARWVILRAGLPEPEGSTWRGVFELATATNGGAPATPLATLHQAMSALGRWSVADLASVHAALKLKYDAARNDYASVDTWHRLATALGAVKRLGVDAKVAAEWVARDDDTNRAQALTAQRTREAAKAKYDYATWLSKAAPLYDVLRERKRDALVRYVIERSIRDEAREIVIDGKKWKNPKRWETADDLFRYFLIDVEMCSCQLTSRLKQAISSTQTFVQRCFLNLERPFVQVSQAERDDDVSIDSWRQWRWMKSYRVWEGARKVFLYPENWILPELRDGKSPFFKELEDELRQSDLTHKSAETALVYYVQKLHDVARVEVLGAYHEIEDPDPNDEAPPRERLHVVARTRQEPAVYYQRCLDLRTDEWTAWEKIDVDLGGDHVQPVVYHGRLYLFWLVVIEKPQKSRKQPAATPSPGANPGPTDAPDPPQQMEIQLAWSERRDRGWTAKNVSREKLIHPWERPLHSYLLRPRYKPNTGLLWLDVYISTSREFNDRSFYDPFTGERRRLTSISFDETARAWHSSSFLFDGSVVGMKMKGLAGFYRLPDLTGAPSNTLSPTSSYEYVHQSFGAIGQAIEKLQGRYEIAPRLPLPVGMHHRNNRLANNRATLNPNRLNVLERGTSRGLLEGARAPFEIVLSPNRIVFDTATYGPESFVYQDAARAYFVRTEEPPVQVGRNSELLRSAYRFMPFYHPFSGLYLRELNRGGVDGLLNRRLQRFPTQYRPYVPVDFDNVYKPVSPAFADPTAKAETIDFDRRGAYSVYNWELFFHAPFLIACQLSQNQRFEEAMRWFHRIFDPTNTEALGSPQRFWITKPFYEQSSDEYRKQRIENLLRAIDQNLAQVAAWKNDPFNPHKIARHRPIAYQKAVVMKYLDNLIAWGDQLFRRDTIEAINEATLLYVLAHEILGPRPVRVPRVEHQAKSYNQLVAGGGLDAFGNASAEIETLTVPQGTSTKKDPNSEPLPYIDTLYFCIPPNDKLLEYWSTIVDRLYKIRHCMNIQGVVRQLPLFEPPIDPALLVKAAAAGVDLGSVLTETSVDPGQYRFRQLLGKAMEFTAEVRALGDKLLSTLEKRDAEGLSLLRSTHEVKVLEASRDVRKKQAEEASFALAALGEQKTMAERKRDYYRGREFLNPWEAAALALSGGSAAMQVGIVIAYALSSGLHFIPQVRGGASGFGGSPHVTVQPVDGQRFGAAADEIAKMLGAIAGALDKFAALASTMGSYQRRKDDWDFQASQADIELRQLDRQIAGAEVRKAIAAREMENLELQIEQTKAAGEYLETKYTNVQLYDWMLSQLTTVYFQAYKLAFDMARRAERCFQFELGRPDLSFIQFGYWDSLKKGLLSGERLTNDLRRMEASYLSLNERERELTKHVSLAQIAPLSLLSLKATGECTIRLDEWLFDMDHPGQYYRRIKSVSITIPCVTGPYTGVHATLSLVAQATRVKDDVAAGYGDPFAPDSDRFRSDRVPVQSIATSHANNDSGLFELSFADERYLPFEGAGAVSEWKLLLPKGSNHFDFATISDVVLHVRYTAREGKKDLADAAKANLAAKLPDNGVVLMELTRDLASEWHRFLHPTAGADQTLSFTLSQEHLPWHARLALANGKSPRLTGVDLVLVTRHNGAFDVQLGTPGAAATPESAPRDPNLESAPHMAKRWAQPGVLPNVLGAWTLRIKKDSAATFRDLGSDDISGAFLVVGFTTK